jgi:hypothetical protein
MTTFDYTSRDYAAIQTDLLARASRQIPEWTSRESSDFGMVMVDLWSYMGDVLHYYVDRAAGESFLDTATQRESVLAIANLLDYVPTGRRPATATIQLDATLTTATDSTPIFIPQYTRFLASPLVDTATSVVFTLNTPIAFVGTVSGASANIVSDGVTYATYPKTTTVSAVVTEGERFTETYTATGLAGQRITLRQSGVVTGSILVNVGEGPNESDVRYAYSARIIDGNSGSKIFTVDIDADNYTIVSFGNGINGKIPTTNASITIEYRRSRGSAGNVVVGAITTLESTTVLNKPALDGIRVIPNTVVASGGVDIESMASLKANIPASFRTQDRAVSLQDYKDIVKRIPGIVRSTAYVDGSNIVQVLALEEPSDYGSALTLALSATKQQEIIDYLEPREIVFASSNVGASVSLTKVNFVANVQVQDGYIQEAVNDNVVAAIRELFSFDNMDFGGRVSLGTVYRTILDIQGVDYAVVTRFTTTSSNVIDSSGGFTGVIAPDTSLLTIASSSTFTINPSGGIIASGG